MPTESTLASDRRRAAGRAPLARTALALALALALPLAAQAIGLGQARVLSSLGEPLVVEIELPDATPAELAAFRAEVASEASYRSAGMEDAPVLRGMLATLGARPNGRAYLRLAGRAPIQTPVLDLLVEASAGAGRLARDYTLSVPLPRQSGGEADPLSLGQARALSSAGQPLRAEVDLPSISPRAAGTLRAVVAPPATYEAAGLDYPSAVAGAAISLRQRANGRSYLQILGSRSVNGDAVTLILDVAWEGGRIVREFTLPLKALAALPSAPAAEPAGPATPGLRPDANVGMVQSVAAAPQAVPAAALSTPAAAAPAASAAAARASTPAAPTASASQPAAAAPRASVPGAPTPVAAAPRASAPATPAVPAASRAATPPPAVRPATSAAARVVVRPGDSASMIAQSHQPVPATLEQTMIAMLRRNPSAFADGNVNRLRAGAVIDLPDSRAATEINQVDALRMLEAQNLSFARMRSVAQGPTPAAPAVAARAASGAAALAAIGPASSGKPADRLTISGGAVKGMPAERMPVPDALARQAERLANSVSRTASQVQRLQAQSPAASSASSPSGSASRPAAALASAPRAASSAGGPAAAASRPASAVRPTTPASSVASAPKELR